MSEQPQPYPSYPQQPPAPKKRSFGRWFMISAVAALLVIIVIVIVAHVNGGSISVTATKTNTTDTTVSDLAKEGSAWKGMNVHFTATISGLVNSGELKD